ncbi:hypothetical protein Bca101_080306 [Brassica carinata]
MEFILGQALLLLCFILSCFLIISTTRSRRKTFGAAAMPPGPPRRPIIGNIHLVGKNPHHSFANLSKTYGPIMSLKFGSLNTVIITSPEAAREVLRTHDQVLSWRSSTNSIRSINHHEVSFVWLPPSSARWRLLRKLSVTLLFSPQRIEASKALRLNKMKELVSFMNESSERDEPVDISRASFITVLNIISNILFSVDLGSYDSKKPNEFQDAVIGVMEAIGNPDAANYFPFMGFLDMQGNRKAIKVASEKLFTVFRGFIDAKIAEKSRGNNKRSSHDFVDALLELTKEDEVELNTNDFVHLLLDLFGAGTDTNSSTVEWAMAELLRNPKTMEKAQAEIDRVIGQKGFVEESDISELPYLQAVVKEVFRLHPAAPLLVPRKVESDVEVLGYMVPKDTQVLVNVWAIGRDPSVWENPTRFDPERFLGKETDVRGRDYELTPFGAGRRICPGLPLAVKIVPLMLASLLYSFDWKLPDGVASEDLDMDETFGLTLHKTNPKENKKMKAHSMGSASPTKNTQMDIITGQAPFLFFSFIISCFLIFTTVRSRRSSRGAETLPPGPPRLPIIGNMHLVGKNPHRSFAHLSKTYGPVMSLKLGYLNTVVIASPNAAREVLRTHDQILSGRYLNEARVEATQALRMKKVQELINFVSECSDREEAVDISRASFVTVVNIISNILFSVDLGNYDSSRSSDFQDMVIGVMESIGKPDLANYFPFMRFLDLQGNRKKVKDCSERLFRVFRGLYDARVKENSLRTDKKDVSSSDFLDALIDLNQGDEAELNLNQIEHLLLAIAPLVYLNLTMYSMCMCQDLFSAGTDTNSSTVEWAMAELLQNPKAMKKVQDEIDSVIGQNGVVQESDISQLQYLQAVVKETFRLHPAAPLLLPRKAETDVEILGFHVPKDTQVLVNVWAVGRDPSRWENPNRFEPERFLGKETDVKGRDYELTPFGAGRRICPGLPLAVKIVPLMLASLLYSFDWKLPNGVASEDLDMDESFGLTLHKTNALHAVPVKKRAIS